MEHKKFMFIHRLVGYVTEIVVVASGRGLLDIWMIFLEYALTARLQTTKTVFFFNFVG